MCTQTFVDLHTNLTFVDLHTNLRGFAHKSAWRGQGSGFSTASGGLEGPGFRFFNGFVCKSTKVCVQIHEGLCANPRRPLTFIMFKPSWICTQTFVDLHTNLRGFAHKPSWICTQTFVDLHTNLRGFAHRPAWRGQGSGFSLASKGQGFRFFTTFRAIKYVRFVP